MAHFVKLTYIREMAWLYIYVTEGKIFVILNLLEHQHSPAPLLAYQVLSCQDSIMYIRSSLHRF